MLPGSGQSPSTGELGSDPIATLKLLTLQGNTVTDLGPSTVDGAAVEGYAVTFDPSVVQNEMNSANLPAWMKQIVSQIKVGGVSEHVYLDGAGDLVRVSQSASAKAGDLGSFSEDESFDFSLFGAPVSITAPPADEVVPFSQILQSAGQTTST